MSAPHPAPGPPDSVLIGGPSSALTPPLPHHPPSLPVPGCLQGPRLRQWPSWAGPAALRGPEPKPAATRPAFPLSCPSGHHLQRRPAGRGGRAKPARTPPWRLSSRIPQLTHCTCIHTTPVTHIPHTCTHHTHTHTYTLTRCVHVHTTQLTHTTHMYTYIPPHSHTIYTYTHQTHSYMPHTCTHHTHIHIHMYTHTYLDTHAHILHTHTHTHTPPFSLRIYHIHTHTHTHSHTPHTPYPFVHSRMYTTHIHVAHSTHMSHTCLHTC